MSSRVDWNRGYVNTWENIVFFVSMCFITFCWAAFSLYALILLGQNTAVNLHASHKKTISRAAHEALLACFLLLCSTRKIVRVQYTKIDLHAAHFVSHACFDSSHYKNWRTHTCSLHTSVNLDVSCTVRTYVCLNHCIYIAYKI